MTECFWCGTTDIDGTYYRWRCPSCGAKLNCCEGEPSCPDDALRWIGSLA